MKVLVDECAPRALSVFLLEQGHECLTVQQAGWSGKQNGDLLNLAETAFDVLVTIDANLRYQQTVSGRKIAVIVLTGRSNRVSDLSPLFARCVAALQTIQPGEMVVLGEE